MVRIVFGFSCLTLIWISKLIYGLLLSLESLKHLSLDMFNFSKVQIIFQIL
jgi:hypothetical protein